MYLSKNSKYVLQNNWLSSNLVRNCLKRNGRYYYSCKIPKDDPTVPPLRLNVPKDPLIDPYHYIWNDIQKAQKLEPLENLPFLESTTPEKWSKKEATKSTSNVVLIKSRNSSMPRNCLSGSSTVFFTRKIRKLNCKKDLAHKKLNFLSENMKHSNRYPHKRTASDDFFGKKFLAKSKSAKTVTEIPETAKYDGTKNSQKFPRISDEFLGEKMVTKSKSAKTVTNSAENTASVITVPEMVNNQKIPKKVENLEEEEENDLKIKPIHRTSAQEKFGSDLSSKFGNDSSRSDYVAAALDTVLPKTKTVEVQMKFRVRIDRVPETATRNAVENAVLDYEVISDDKPKTPRAKRTERVIKDVMKRIVDKTKDLLENERNGEKLETYRTDYEPHVLNVRERPDFDYDVMSDYKPETRTVRNEKVTKDVSKRIADKTADILEDKKNCERLKMYRADYEPHILSVQEKPDFNHEVINYGNKTEMPRKEGTVKAVKDVAKRIVDKTTDILEDKKNSERLKTYRTDCTLRKASGKPQISSFQETADFDCEVINDDMLKTQRTKRTEKVVRKVMKRIVDKTKDILEDKKNSAKLKTYRTDYKPQILKVHREKQDLNDEFSYDAVANVHDDSSTRPNLTNATRKNEIKRFPSKVLHKSSSNKRFDPSRSNLPKKLKIKNRYVWPDRLAATANDDEIGEMTMKSPKSVKMDFSRIPKPLSKQITIVEDGQEYLRYPEFKYVGLASAANRGFHKTANVNCKLKDVKNKKRPLVILDDISKSADKEVMPIKTQHQIQKEAESVRRTARSKGDGDYDKVYPIGAKLKETRQSTEISNSITSEDPAKKFKFELTNYRQKRKFANRGKEPDSKDDSEKTVKEERVPEIWFKNPETDLSNHGSRYLETNSGLVDEDSVKEKSTEEINFANVENSGNDRDITEFVRGNAKAATKTNDKMPKSIVQYPAALTEAPCQTKNRAGKEYLKEMTYAEKVKMVENVRCCDFEMNPLCVRKLEKPAEKHRGETENSVVAPRPEKSAVSKMCNDLVNVASKNPAGTPKPEKSAVPKISDNLVNVTNESLTMRKDCPSTDSLDMMKKVKNMLNMDLNNAVKIFGPICDKKMSVVCLIEEPWTWKVDENELENAIKTRNVTRGTNSAVFIDADRKCHVTFEKAPENPSAVVSEPTTSSCSTNPALLRKTDKVPQVEKSAVNVKSVVVYDSESDKFKIDSLQLNNILENKRKRGESAIICHGNALKFDEKSLQTLANENILEIKAVPYVPTGLALKSGDSILIYDEENSTWRVDFSILKKKREQEEESELNKRSELILERIQKEKAESVDVPPPVKNEKSEFDYGTRKWRLYDPERIRKKPNLKNITGTVSSARDIRKKNSDLYDHLFTNKKKSNKSNKERWNDSKDSSNPSKSAKTANEEMKMAEERNLKREDKKPPKGLMSGDPKMEKWAKIEKLVSEESRKRKASKGEAMSTESSKEKTDETKTEKSCEEERKKEAAPATGNLKKEKMVSPQSGKGKITENKTEKSSLEEKEKKKMAPEKVGKEIATKTENAKDKTPSCETEKSALEEIKEKTTFAGERKNENVKLQDNSKENITESKKEESASEERKTEKSKGKKDGMTMAENVKDKMAWRRTEKLALEESRKRKTCSEDISKEISPKGNVPERKMAPIESWKMKKPLEEVKKAGITAEERGKVKIAQSRTEEIASKKTAMSETKKEKITEPKIEKMASEDLKKEKPSLGDSKRDHYVSKNMLEMSKPKEPEIFPNTTTQKPETVKINLSSSKHLPSKVTEINLSNKRDKIRDADKRKDDQKSNKNEPKTFYQNFEKYQTPFIEPDYEEVSKKIDPDIKSNPNLKKLDNLEKTLVLHENPKQLENVESWMKNETNKMASLLIKVLQEAAESKGKRKMVDKLSEGSRNEPLRKNESGNTEISVIKIKTTASIKEKPPGKRAGRIPVQTVMNVRSCKTAEAKITENPVDVNKEMHHLTNENFDPLGINMDSLDDFKIKKKEIPRKIRKVDKKKEPEEIIVPAFPATANKKKDKSPSKELSKNLAADIPGPDLLKKASAVWKYLPTIGCQATVYAYQLVQLGTSIFGTYKSSTVHNQVFDKLFCKYGPIVKLEGPLGGQIILINRPEHITSIIEEEKNHPIRSVFDSVDRCRILFQQNENMMLPLDDWKDPKWDELRQNTNDFTLKDGLWFDYLDQVGNDFVNRIKTTKNVNNTIDDLLDDTKRWSLECLGYVAFNKPLGCLDAQTSNWPTEGNRLLSYLSQASDSICKCETGFQLWRFMETPASVSLSSACQALEHIIGKHVRLAEISLTKKREEGKLGTDLSLIESMLLNDGLTHDEIVYNIMDMLLIGVNTCTCALGFLLYRISQNNRVQRAILKEIKEVLAERTSKLNYQQLDSLKYLQACLKETLRLNAPIPFLIRALPFDIKLMDYEVPKGSFVVMDSQVARMKEQNFDDPEKFLPERWFDPNLQPYTSFPFCHGSRAEIGKRLAEIQIRSCAAKILRNFRIEYNYGDIRGSDNVFSLPDKPLKLTFIERED